MVIFHVGTSNVKLETESAMTHRLRHWDIKKDSHAILLVYDMCSKESFDSIASYWLNEVDSYADPNTLRVLVGNKADLKDQQTVLT